MKYVVTAEHYSEWETLKEDDEGFALETEVHDSNCRTLVVLAVRSQLRAARSAAKKYHDNHRTPAEGDGTPEQTGPIAGIEIWKMGEEPGDSKVVETPYDYYF